MGRIFSKIGCVLLLLLVPAMFSAAQQSPKKKQSDTKQFDIDPTGKESDDFGCGSPASESQKYDAIPARLILVTGGDTLVVSTKGARRLKVRLAGCDAGQSQFAVKKRLRLLLRGQALTIVGNRNPEKKGEMDAVVLTRTGEVNRLLLTEGLVRFRQGDSGNRVSRVTLCEYEKLSQQARRENRGRWKEGHFDGLRMVATIVTDLGTLKVELFPEDAPKTVENFKLLANKGFYDSLIFHRIIKGFMIQGGDPKGTGMGGESAFGGDFEDEINPKSPLYTEMGYVPGVMAMANKGPNTNGSQFFIMHGRVPLPPRYTIFGRVIKGLEVVNQIAAVPTGPGDRPVKPVHILSAKVTEEKP
jgi:cyclophilin family peptidyl-prolyl cis-trans isomerase/endonuclease YncB( thermonuclease family)